jgi:hypothetical protein
VSTKWHNTQFENCIYTTSGATLTITGNRFTHSTPTPYADRVWDHLESRGVVSVHMTDGEMFRTVLSFMWAALLTLLLIAETMSGKMAANMAVFTNITPLMLLQNFGIIVLVGLAVAALWTIKPLRFSWMSLFNGGQEGGDNINVTPFRIPWLGVLFGVLFFLNLPTFALWEERMFRLGVVDWSDAVWWAFIFGMVHCLVGVPLAAGVALTIPGLWFHYQCFEGGVVLSTAHHTAYNAIIASVMILVAVITSISGKPPEMPA